MNLKYKLVMLMCVVIQNVTAQQFPYTYKRELRGVVEQWHKVGLPDDVFGSLQGNMNGIRVVGLTPKGDTVEAPYLMEIRTPKSKSRVVAAKIINRVRSGQDAFFTLELLENKPVNYIELAFAQKEFDWKITLEGSQDQRQWFTVLEDYRILSFHNEPERYTFTSLRFPEADFSYYRIKIPGSPDPVLQAADIYSIAYEEGIPVEYQGRMQVKQDKDNKQTVLTLDLGKIVPVDRLKLNVASDHDYFRKIEISYLADSVATQNGMRYHYQPLLDNVLSSLDTNLFQFNSTLLRHLKVYIQNQDDLPLEISNIWAFGSQHELVFRVPAPGQYFLLYGDRLAQKPIYDLARFQDQIPELIPQSSLGPEGLWYQGRLSTQQAIFENKFWLYSLMTVIALMLGGFTWTMLKKR
jgi:hypothetical protein